MDRTLRAEGLTIAGLPSSPCALELQRFRCMTIAARAKGHAGGCKRIFQRVYARIQPSRSGASSIWLSASMPPSLILDSLPQGRHSQHQWQTKGRPKVHCAATAPMHVHVCTPAPFARRRWGACTGAPGTLSGRRGWSCRAAAAATATAPARIWSSAACRCRASQSPCPLLGARAHLRCGCTAYTARRGPVIGAQGCKARCHLRHRDAAAARRAALCAFT